MTNIVFTALTFFAVLFSSSRHSADYSELYERYPELSYREASVKIRNDGALCSGFIVETDKVMTAAHCITNPVKKIDIMDSHGKVHKVIKVLHWETDYDLAILQIKPTPINNVVMDCPNSRAPSIEFLFYVLGYPRSVGLPTIKTLVNINYRNKETIILLGAVDFGSSGSMVVDRNGNLQGVVSFISYKDNLLVTGIVPTDVICNILGRRINEGVK